MRCYVKVFILLILSTSTFASSRFWPTAQEWKASFYAAAVSPFTWVPLAGAAVIAVTQTDTCISNWAIRTTPIYGSNQNAANASNHFKSALATLDLVSFLFVPQRDEDKSWLLEKGEYFLVMTAALGIPSAFSGTTKSAWRRERPIESSTYSFPSGHSTFAFASAAVISRNVDTYRFSYIPTFVAKASVYTMAAGVAWGRVEAGAHYPTDVLVGAAIGNFFASWIYNAFMNVPCNDRLNVRFMPAERGFYLNIDKEFD